MPTETEDRVNVAIERETHETFAQIAKLRDMSQREAAQEAITEWNRRNAPAAQKKANQLLKSAA